MLNELLPTRSDLPSDLLDVDQWVCWQRQDRDGKATKVPIDPSTGEYASSTDSSTWTDFATAREYAEATDTDGVGFVFTEADPFVGVDLDDCRVPETGTGQDWATHVIDRLDSYTELSPSGTGFHILVTGELPDGRNRSGDFEMYDDARFFTVTGAHVSGTPTSIHHRHDALQAVYDEHIAPEEPEEESGTTTGPTPAEDTLTEPDRAGNGDSIADDELLERARNAANGEKFQRLWRGETSGYESHSEADMGLCSLLAFWTGGDAQQVDRLFRQSELMREKWDEVHFSDGSMYGEKTIKRAIAGTDEFYSPQAAADETDFETGGEGRAQVRDSELARLEKREAERLVTVAELQDDLRDLQSENEQLSEELAAEREYIQELESELAELRSESLMDWVTRRIRKSGDTDR